MGKVKQGTECSVQDCKEAAVRSFAADKVTEILRNESLSLKPGLRRRAYLCQKHYKIFKKHQRKEKKIEKWRYGA